MRGERYEICWISVPFTAGVAVAAAMAQITVLTCCLTDLALGAAILLMARYRRKPYAALAFFISGLSVYATDRLTGGIFAGPAIFEKVHHIAGAAAQMIMDTDFGSPTTGPLACALVTGDRSFLPSGITGIFRAAGASHILALSGLHLGIIYSIIARILSIAGNSRPARATKYFLTIVLAGLYVIATGAGPSVTRAYIYIILSETARITCRRARPLHLWMTALLIQLTFSPSSILSVGFQLSYMAMAGIAVIYPLLRQFFPQEGTDAISVTARKMWEVMALTISCQITTAPLAWLRFRTFPKYFLITNLMVMPLATVLIILSMSTLLAACLGQVPGLLLHATDFIAGVIIRILEVISSL